jgi:hypothetical protein
MNNLSLRDEFLGHNLPFDAFTTCSSFVGPMKCFCECSCCFRLNPQIQHPSLRLEFGYPQFRLKVHHECET